MINHVWSVLCSRAVVDRDSNNVSLENIFEQFQVNAEPKPGGFIGIPFHIMSLWIRADENTPAKANTKLILVSPSKEIINSFESEIDLTNHERFRNKAEFTGIPASESGRYIFQVAIQQAGSENWSVVAEIPLSVNFNLPEQAEN